MTDLLSFRGDVIKTQAVLMENLPWSPFDFIRDISRQGDRELFVENVTRPMEENVDCRFIHRFPDGDELIVFAEKLSWDSNFFGYGIGRISGVFPLNDPFYRPFADYTPALRILIEEAKNKGIRYLFAFVDPRDLATLRALGNLGFALIETRVYYHRSIKGYHYKERFPVRIADTNDVDSLGRAAKQMVNLYDRFHADPFIPGEDAGRLMHKWVEASILESFADITMVPDSPNPSAFCTVKYHQDKWSKWGVKLAQCVVLAAVSPEFKGWVRKLISEINYHLCEIGAEHVYYATQITNKPMIWVAEDLGYRFGKGEHVLRIVL